MNAIRAPFRIFDEAEYATKMEDGIIKVSERSMVVVKGINKAGIYLLLGYIDPNGSVNFSEAKVD